MVKDYFVDDEGRKHLEERRREHPREAALEELVVDSVTPLLRDIMHELFETNVQLGYVVLTNYLWLELQDSNASDENMRSVLENMKTAIPLLIADIERRRANK